jgi:hypothetical protein
VNIISIEPTPSPNTMKLNLSESLPKGIQRTYTVQSPRKPELIEKLLEIDGVRSIFHTADFMAIDRYPQGNWQLILSRVREVFGGAGNAGAEHSDAESLPDSWGRVQVYVQMFRDIPMQIRLQEETELVKVGLPERFMHAGMQAGTSSPTLLKERKLIDWGIRYGELSELSEQLIQELEAAYPAERLEALVARAAKQGEGEPEPELRQALSADAVMKLFEENDWKLRYAALQQLVTEHASERLQVLARALKDPEASIRRQAVVELGDIGAPEALPYLFSAMKDRSVSVRRTAGDTLNDIGDVSAIGPMNDALKDPNKLVRWRAARFLYEYGDEQALEALRTAANDPEFEVSLQIRMALARIEGGGAAEGSVWQQMTRRNEKTSDKE